MSAVIKSRTFGGVVDQRARFLNSTYFRGFTVPATWASLRIGLRLCMDGSATTAGVNNYFTIGLSNGQSWGTNAIYYLNDYSGLNYTAASGGNAAYYHVKSTLAYTAKNVNNVVSLGTAGNVDLYLPADATAGVRRMLFIDVTKGSPNWTLKLFFPNVVPSAALDVSVADFIDTVQMPIPTYTGHTSSTLPSLAFNETAGAINSVFCGWNTSATPVYCETSDLAVLKLS